VFVLFSPQGDLNGCAQAGLLRRCISAVGWVRGAGAARRARCRRRCADWAVPPALAAEGVNPRQTCGRVVGWEWMKKEWF